MADEVTPGQVRARRFDVVRKGYERSQVDAYLAELADRIESLQDVITDAKARDVALGIDDQEALARELHTIGGEVGAILEAARSAAESMRTRAGDDAKEWRATAEADSTQAITDAREQSQSLRASAWNEGSSLLASAEAEAGATIAAAKEEALFLRAEAEREALRLTGDAKRDREEMLRSTRLEADQIVDGARRESEGVLAAANQQAEMAQERARALEDRRTELLSELEAARSSITELETEIESRRQELEAPEEIPETDGERSHHTSDGGSVRIVAPTRVVPLEPVDADELAAEVQALRSVGKESPREPSQPVAEHAPVAEEADVRPPVEQEIVETATDEDEEVVAPIEAAPEPEVDEAAEATHPESGEAEAMSAEPTAEAVDRTDATPAMSVAADGAGADDADDEIGSLFARLRTSGSEAVPDSADVQASEEGTSPAAVTQEPEPVPAVHVVESVETDEAVQAEQPADAQASVLEKEAGLADADLIPLRNSALRDIKKSLVELQNETLEHLRNDPAWEPDEAYTRRFDVPFSELARAVDGSPDDTAADVFATDLYDALSGALDRTREAGAGDREVAASASKVFRTWRSDEAERRVVAASGAPAHA